MGYDHGLEALLDGINKVYKKKQKRGGQACNGGSYNSKRANLSDERDPEPNAQMQPSYFHKLLFQCRAQNKTFLKTGRKHRVHTIQTFSKKAFLHILIFQSLGFQDIWRNKEEMTARNALSF